MGRKKKHYDIPPKRTFYNNEWHDSQQEAQWHVLFDKCGFGVTYHPATFKTGKTWGDENKGIVYTPDFYIHDLGMYCEVKPTDISLNNYQIQMKISAAMDKNFTSVADGLLILGPIENFHKNDDQEYFIWGEFYQWHFDSIKKGHWGIGKSDSKDPTFLLTQGEHLIDNTSNYPRFAQDPHVRLHLSYPDKHASEVVYHALIHAMYAEKNGFFTFEKDSESLTEKSEPLYDDLPFSGSDDDDDI